MIYFRRIRNFANSWTSHFQAGSRKRARHLKFESLENRYAFSVDLHAFGQSLGEHHLQFDDASGLELHALTVLPTQLADPANPQNTLSTQTPVSLADTFRLHSNAAARQRIYLDFDGHVASSTVWNANFNNGQNITTPAFDFDGNASLMSSLEMERIQWIWERVAEDFIPFNVDVTTEDPGAAALMKSSSTDTDWGIRVVIGGSSTDWLGVAAGGVAYLDSFNWTSDTPTYIFPAQLGNGNEKYTAEAISHEVGHTLGLDHDGRISPPEEYYSGQGSGNTSWSPIMGAGYYKNVTQWSKGEYASASQTQDDLSIITTKNGFSYRVDDHGSTGGTASSLDVTGTLISDWGIIERTTDVDVFAFATNAGTIEINASPLNRGPNLDVVLELYDSSNQLVASANPTDALTASLNVTVTAQKYFLHVSGTGKGNPLIDGYSRYASLGQYFISGTLVAVQDDFLSISADNASKSEGNSGSTAFTFAVNRTGNTSGSTTVNYTVTGSGASAAAANDFVGGILPSGTVSFAAGETSKTITVQIAGDTVVEQSEGFTVSLANASGSSVISGATAVGNIQNDDVLQTAGVTVTPTSGLVVGENRSKASFTVVLTAKPTADVTIQVTSLDRTEGTVGISSLRFRPANWNVSQTVVVQGVDDFLRDGNIVFTVQLSAARSTDARYNGRQVDDVQVINQDNEQASKSRFASVAGESSFGDSIAAINANMAIEAVDQIMQHIPALRSKHSNAIRGTDDGGGATSTNRDLPVNAMLTTPTNTLSQSTTWAASRSRVSSVEGATRRDRLSQVDILFSKFDRDFASGAGLFD